MDLKVERPFKVGRGPTARPSLRKLEEASLGRDPGPTPALCDGNCFLIGPSERLRFLKLWGMDRQPPHFKDYEVLLKCPTFQIYLVFSPGGSYLNRIRAYL